MHAAESPLRRDVDIGVPGCQSLFGALREQKDETFEEGLLEEVVKVTIHVADIPRGGSERLALR